MELLHCFHRCLPVFRFLCWGCFIVSTFGAPSSIFSFPTTSIAVIEVAKLNATVLFSVDAVGTLSAFDTTSFHKIFQTTIADPDPTYTSFRYDAGSDMLFMCCRYASSPSVVYGVHPESGSVAWTRLHNALSCDKIVLGSIEKELYSITWFLDALWMLVLSIQTGQVRTSSALKWRRYTAISDGGSNSVLPDVVGPAGRRYIFVNDWYDGEILNIDAATRTIWSFSKVTGFFYPKSYNPITGVLHGIHQSTGFSPTAAIRKYDVSRLTTTVTEVVGVWVFPNSPFEWDNASSRFAGIICATASSCPTHNTNIKVLHWYANGTVGRQTVPILGSPLNGTLIQTHIRTFGAIVATLTEVRLLVRSQHGNTISFLSVLDTNTGDVATYDLLDLDSAQLSLLASDVVSVLHMGRVHILKLCPGNTVYSIVLQACMPMNCSATQRWDPFTRVCLDCSASSVLLPYYLSTCALCPAGTDRVQHPSNNTCSKCRPGFARPADSLTVCTRCEGSTPLATPSQHACAPSCLPGTYCEPSSSYANQMKICPAGWYCRGLTAAPALCPRGHYCNAGSSAPTPCRAGYYNPINGSTDITSCISCVYRGYNCSQGSAEPLPCPAGYYCPDSSKAPIGCPAGFFNNLMQQESQSACTECPAGTFCPQGSQSPVTCPQGSYCGVRQSFPRECSSGRTTATNGSTHISDCIFCPAGIACKDGIGYPCPVNAYCPGDGSWYRSCPQHTYHNLTGQSSVTSCVPCAPGTIRRHEMQVCTPCTPGRRWVNQTTPQAVAMECERCPLGSIQPNAGGLTCLGCPAGYEGNSAGTECNFCHNGFIKPLAGNHTCVRCPLGHVSNSSLTCIRCPANTYAGSFQSSCDACAAGYSSLPGSDFCSCSAGTTKVSGVEGCIACPMPAGCVLRTTDGISSAGCAEGYEGYLCGACSNGYFKSMNAECEVCGQHWGALIVFVLLFIGVPAVAILCLRNIVAVFLLPLRLFIYHAQSLAMLLRLKIRWPTNFFAVFSISLNVNLQLDSAGPECFVDMPYSVKWAFSMSFAFLIPLCSIVLLVYSRCTTSENAVKWGQRIVLLAQLTFGIVVAKSFDAFQCVEGPSSSTDRLRSDTRVVCGQEEHLVFWILSLFVLIAATSLLGVMWLMMITCNDEYQDMSGDDAFKRYSTAPLYRDYKPDGCMSITFELWLLFQKIALGGLSILAMDGSLGVGGMCAVAIIHLVLMLWVRPFKNSDGTLPYNAQKCLVKIPVFGRVARFCSTDTTNKHEISNAVASTVTRMAGLLLLLEVIEPAAWLDITLIAFNVPPLIFTFFAHGVFAERARRKASAMSSNARCCKRNKSMLTRQPTLATAPTTWDAQPVRSTIMQVNPLSATRA